jgi:hypothetical protein
MTTETLPQHAATPSATTPSAIDLQKRIIGSFTKQKWGGRKGDDAIWIGEEAFDATETILRMRLTEIVALEDQAETTNSVGQAHVQWNDPHYVTIVGAICQFFDVEELDSITETMLAEKRLAYLPAPSQPVHDSLGGQPPADIVRVRHWDVDEPETPFLMSIIDARDKAGHHNLEVEVAPEDGDTDDVLSVTFEIGSLPGSKTHTQVMHVRNDNGEVVFSLYKQNDSFIIRSDPAYKQCPTMLPFGEMAILVSPVTPPHH